MPLRHAVEVRYPSFDDPAFLTLARDAVVAVVFADHPDYPAIRGHDTGFSYARLMNTREEEPTGYSPAATAAWAGMARAQAKDGDVFAFFISGAKLRAPAAAQVMIVALG